ncbi:AAA family ATPase [Aeromonas veronii]|uniref:AAA family ATPase n=1 Tax=Aeromonas veronii TaxID=654 RepID=UPI00223132DC|nr:AAA family ATPase [Aeromonas veronii]EKP0298513.1 AAA family ATPase [Aeromonas veronii]UZE60943.1 AAA family ATPase [Aeromonas veronii]
MELIYLFIDNYKVIKDKEISLSSQFNVKNENLSFFVSKSSIPDNFFSENIDIVSFFGTNGSGKSTTIEFILSLYEDSLPESASFIAIFEEFGEVFYISEGLGNVKVFSENAEPVRILKSDLEVENFSAVYFSHALEPLAVKPTFTNVNIINCSNTHLLSRAYLQKYKDVKSQFELFKNVNLSFLKVHDVPMLGSINLTSELSKRLEGVIATVQSISHIFNEDYNIRFFITNDLPFIYDTPESYYQTKNDDYISLLTNFIKYNFPNRNNSLQKNPISALIYISLLDSTLKKVASIILNKLNSKNSNKDLYSLKYRDDIVSILTQLAKSLNNDVWYEQINLHLSNLLMPGIPKRLEKEISFFIDKRYDAYSFDNFVRQWSIPFHDNNDRFTFGVSSYNEFIGITELISNLRSALSNLDIKWNGISSGQYSALTMYSRLYEFIPKNAQHINVFIDEGEVFLHPELQRHYVSNLIEFIEKIKQHKSKIKLIVTSHSPLILSDLPKESTNFFGYDIDAEKSFFGANLYDLYSEGFTVNKTVGEFSYRKIKAISSSIKNKKSDPLLSKMIDIIGDDFLRKVLKES